MPSPTTDAMSASLQAMSLPDTSRVWLYTANRVLTDAECDVVQMALSSFRGSWAAHGTPLRSDSTVLLNQVVVLAVDEGPQIATGCSIDASVAALKSLNSAATSLSDLDVMDRSWVVFHAQEEGADWQRAKLHDFWAMRKAGSLTDEVLILESTVSTLGDLRTSLIKRLGDSWHAHMW